MNRTHFYGYAVLLALFMMTVAVLLPARANYRFFEDDYLHLENVRKMSRSPAAVFEVEGKDRRRHPLYYALLFTEQRFFGKKITPYFLVHYLFHLLNTILIIRLAAKFGASAPASQLAGLLFFSSAAFYNIMIKFTATLELQGLFFFLLATLAWLRFLAGTRAFALLAFIFQMAALLTYEVAVMFPVLAGGLTILFEGDAQKRRRVFWRALLPMAVVTLFVFFILTKDFWFSNALPSKIAPQSLSLLFLKCITFIRMFLAPVFEGGKGNTFWAYFDFGLKLMVPVFSVVIAACVYLWRTNLLAVYSINIPKKLVGASALWIAVTISPHLPYPGDFAHATRYMLFPAVGVAIIYGTFLAMLISSVRRVWPRAGMVLSVLTLCYIATINLSAVSFQFERYQRYLREHPDEDFTAKVDSLEVQSVP